MATCLVMVAFVLVTTVVAVPPAGATNGFVYENCYEHSLAVPAPAAEIAAHLPAGFRPGSMTAFTGLPTPPGDEALSGYVSIALSCDVAGDPVSFQLLAAIVEPPGDLRLDGASWHLFQLDFVTSSAADAARYHEWCIPARLGDVTLDLVETAAGRIGTVAGTGAAEMVTQVGGEQLVFPGGTGRMFVSDGGELRIYHIAYPSADMLIGTGSIVFDDAPAPSGIPARPALAAHIYGKGSSNAIIPVEVC